MTLKLNERYPGRFNNPSSDYPQGSFKNRTAPGAKDGSYLEQDWANDKEGFFQSMIAKAALTPNGTVDKVGSSQLFNALIRLAQNQEGVAYTTTGAAGAFVVTPAPVVSSYSVFTRLQVIFSVGGGATPTINVSGLGAKSIKQYNSSGVKIPAIIIAGQSSDIFYDGTDFILLDQLPNSFGVTSPQFDNSLNLATTAWVRGVGKQYSSIAVATTTYTATVANAGGLILGNAASLFNTVLPSAAALPPGATITIYCYGAGGMQVYVAGSDTINFPPSVVTNFLVQQGSTFTLTSNGINAWYAEGVLQSTETVFGGARIATTATALAASNDTDVMTALKTKQSMPFTVASGVATLKLPNGYIQQIFDVTESISASDYKFFPVSFPTECVGVFPVLLSTTSGGYGNNFGLVLGDVTKDRFLISAGGSFSAEGRFRAIAIGR